jgi:hypothetical protein
MTDHVSKRVSEGQVAAVLRAIAATPDRREKPAEGDPPGDFDFWFDGGACKCHTGSEHYLLADGTTAVVAVPAAWLWVSIAFPGGATVDVVQRREPAEADRQGSGEAPEGPREGVSLKPRPQAWHCIFCGWRCHEDFNDDVCKSCDRLRPFVGSSATMAACRRCGQWNLAVASFCEWCGGRVEPAEG